MVDGIYEIPVTAPFFYICGVTNAWQNNLHFVVKPKLGEMAMLDAAFGIRFTIFNAKRVPISPLPVGWNGLTKQFTTCRNFQFGVEQFGYTPATPQPQKLF